MEFRKEDFTEGTQLLYEDGDGGVRMAQVTIVMSAVELIRVKDIITDHCYFIHPTSVIRITKDAKTDDKNPNRAFKKEKGG